MNITAKQVSDLREQTGAGMMKCKEALVECQGDFEKAVDFLRKKGLVSAANKSDRATSQGLVFVATSPDFSTAAMLELNCETDFVARNEQFVALGKSLVQQVLLSKTIKTPAELEAVKLPSGQTVEESRKLLIAKIGENMGISRFERFEIPAGKSGAFDTYIHGEGTLGVLVMVETGDAKAASSAEVRGFAHDVALQVAAMKPLYTNRSEVPASIVTREKDVIHGQIKNDPKNASKPENVVAKIVEGRIDKYYKENCLEEQMYVKDDSKSIKALGEEIGKKIGTTLRVAAFRRWTIGEKAAAPAAEASCCGNC